MEEKRIVKSWQAGLMLLVGVAVIIVGLLVMRLNNRIVLALDGVIMCLMAWCFGIPYEELQQGIKDIQCVLYFDFAVCRCSGERMDGQRYRTSDDLLRHEGADTGIVPASGVYPLHTDVHHGGHLLGAPGHRGRGRHGCGPGPGRAPAGGGGRLRRLSAMCR